MANQAFLENCKYDNHSNFENLFKKACREYNLAVTIYNQVLAMRSEYLVNLCHYQL
jgi:hypothetical protein